MPFAFGSLRLHRLEAACIPSNAASIRLLEKAGFVREGYAREYLCINGLWQDHLLFARLDERLTRVLATCLGAAKVPCYNAAARL